METVYCVLDGSLVSEVSLFTVNNVENDDRESEDICLALISLNTGQLIVDSLAQVQRSSSIEVLFLGNFDRLSESEVSDDRGIFVHHEDVSLFQVEVADLLVV